MRWICLLSFNNLTSLTSFTEINWKMLIRTVRVDLPKSVLYSCTRCHVPISVEQNFPSGWKCWTESLVKKHVQDVLCMQHIYVYNKEEPWSLYCLHHSLKYRFLVLLCPYIFRYTCLHLTTLEEKDIFSWHLVWE